MAAQSLRLLDLESKFEDNSHGELETSCCETARVSVSASDLLPLLLDAALANRAWLEDFADDSIEITQDLYEVLLAYRRFRKEAA